MIDKNHVKEMMKLANEVLECTEEIVRFAKEKEYDPYVLSCAIESIHRLLKEKENVK